ncbi:MAG: AAA family ATPase [Armatimonadota bacterium]
MSKREIAVITLDDDARAFIDAIVEQWGKSPTPPGVLQWLLTLLERHEALVREIVPRLEEAITPQRLRVLVQRGEAGEALSPEQLVARAGDCARGRQVSLRDLACIILTLTGCALVGADAETASCADCDTVFVSLSDEMPEFEEESTTPLLDKLGVDLTREASEGALAPVVDREEEIRLLIETLCRSTKRNPALVGPAGVGKTAIVEGLAHRIVKGAVPALLQQVRIVMLSVTSLVAGCTLVGEFEERINGLLKEARQLGIVLFIDEAHTMLGAGAAGRNGNDLANMLKQAMARGEIACIAATTDEEYRREIESDPALERRFQPIRVQEMTAAQSLYVLKALSVRLAERRGVSVPAPLLEWMVGFAAQHMRNRHFPDKAVDILEQCVAYALTQDRTELTQEDAETVARRMVGMPLQVDARLAALEEALRRRSLLPPATVAQLISRLGVTMRGLDFRAARPNAVLLLAGPAATQGRLLCELIAEALFGAAERVVALEMGRIVNAADLSMLLGSPPGYIGYGGRVALHEVMQMPWCVLRVEDVEACHPTARDVLAQGLHRGCVTLADGKRAFLSDMVVVLCADGPLGADAPIGFGPHDGTCADNLRERAAHYLGEDLVEEVDILCAELCDGPDATLRWLQESLLTDLDTRFRPQGICLRFDPSLLDWLAARGTACDEPADWERLVENALCPLIIPHLPAPGRDAVQLLLTVTGGVCSAERC